MAEQRRTLRSDARRLWAAVAARFEPVLEDHDHVGVALATQVRLVPVKASSHAGIVVAAGVVLALVAATLIVVKDSPASAGPAPGLCDMNETRGEVPDDFPVDACVNPTTGLWLRNTRELPVRFEAEGDTGTPVRIPVNYSLAAMATRLRYRIRL